MSENPLQMPARQLHHDWVDALSVFVKRGGQVRNKHGLTEVYHSYLPTITRLDGITAYKFSKKDILVDQSIFDLDIPRVERIEVLVSAIAQLMVDINDWTEADYTAICTALGCCANAKANLRERWRLIQYQSDPRFEYKAESLVAKMFEDRKPCGWCKGPLVTGSQHQERPDLHEGCYEYVLRVIRPAVRTGEQNLKTHIVIVTEGGANVCTRCTAVNTALRLEPCRNQGVSQ